MKTKQLTMLEIAHICVKAEMGLWPSTTAVAIGWAESRGNAYAININDPIDPAYLSLDLGIWQTNTHWHPEISPAEALNPELQIEHVKRIAGTVHSGGYISYNWIAWSTYKLGYYIPFYQLAYQAVRQASGA